LFLIKSADAFFRKIGGETTFLGDVR